MFSLASRQKDPTTAQPRKVSCTHGLEISFSLLEAQMAYSESSFHSSQLALAGTSKSLDKASRPNSAAKNLKIKLL